MKKYLILIVTFAFFLNVYAQVPHLTGKIEISIQSGTFDAELMLSNLPDMDNYSIWINRGLNIEYFRDAEDKFNYYYNYEYAPENSRISSEETIKYYFPSSDKKSRYLPNSFMVSYTGKFPVIADTLRAYQWRDWKGNMAFNGQSFRASEQSAWYPIIYDRENDIVINKYTYEITVNCDDCSALYSNGDLPVKGSRATFSSDEAVPLLLFTGNFDFSKYEDIYFINADLDQDKKETLKNLIQNTIGFYEMKLQIPYGQPVVCLGSTPISIRNSWLFVTYPTIAVVAPPQHNWQSYFDPETHKFSRNPVKKLIAHELCHYYIGNIFIPNSTLTWFFSEGLTDYLAILAIKQIEGEAFYREIISDYAKQVAKFEPIPLNKITMPGEIDEFYRYRYAPLLLTAIEKEVGEETMWAWAREVIGSNGQLTDFDFFKSTLMAAGISEDTVEKIIEKFIDNKNALQNIMEKIQ
ncbi:MAG: M1 family aminopeptidase [Bacteroidales bacterium]